MDSQKRLAILQNLLNRLTGAEPAVQQVQPPPKPVDPKQRRLQVLQSLLLKLQSS